MNAYFALSKNGTVRRWPASSALDPVTLKGVACSKSIECHFFSVRVSPCSWALSCNVQITGNTSLSGGGGLHLETLSADASGLAVLSDQFVISDNSAANRDGGIWAVDGANVVVNGFHVTGLPATTISEQPLWLFRNVAQGSAGNPAGDQGGGVWLDNANLTASAAWFDRNTTTGIGGAIFAVNGSQVQINRTVDDPFGGTAPCHSPLECSLIARNRATDTGGAIFTEASGTYAQLDKTVTGIRQRL